ncbi:MAG: ferrous iron transport protein A [Verrucomicrobia bacterium]|nr:ferrous iron transport protein A [Verrucomicrobiota bacterium]
MFRSSNGISRGRQRSARPRPQRASGPNPGYRGQPTDNEPIFVANQSQLQEVGALTMQPMQSHAQAVDLELDSAMTLSQVGVGCDVRIRLLQGPSCERLRDLGFCEELRIRKLSSGPNLVCAICGTRMAISRELADQVYVEAVA